MGQNESSGSFGRERESELIPPHLEEREGVRKGGRGMKELRRFFKTILKGFNLVKEGVMWNGMGWQVLVLK
jgi:hypothetical protein